ncbi:MAG: sodium-dependent bicarbonate transport family permease [Luteolibacter sp.]
MLADNLVSPVVLCFALGIIAKWIKSDLAIPEPIYQGLSIYLLLAIGLKGGAALTTTPFQEMLLPSLATLVLGVVTAVSAFYLIKHFGKLGQEDSAAVAAHYGSVSVVTFLAATEAVKRSGMAYEGFLPALVAVLEVPGIIVALLFASNSSSGGWKKALHEVVTGKSIVLLVGGLIIGAACGPAKLVDVEPFFKASFKGALCIFLLELGLIAGKRLADAGKAGSRLLALGCLIPIFHGTLGVLAGLLSGMTPGGAAILGAMAGSASYIAAPAAVRIALPKANPGYYLTLALGITFPFNLAFGIPLFQKTANLIHSWL